MINLFLDSAYWAGATRMNGPQKLASNLIDSLDQECIPFSINEETDLFMTLIELKPLSLLMKIKPSLLKYREKIGMFLSSSFKINTDPLKSAVKKKVSHAD